MFAGFYCIVAKTVRSLGIGLNTIKRISSTQLPRKDWNNTHISIPELANFLKSRVLETLFIIFSPMLWDLKVLAIRPWFAFLQNASRPKRVRKMQVMI